MTNPLDSRLRSTRWFGSGVFVAAVVASWQGWIWFLDVPRVIAPGPLDVLEELGDPAWLLGPMLYTSGLTALGIALGLAAGITTAIFCWWFPSSRPAIVPAAVLAQTIPPVVLVPIFGQVFGFGSPSVVSIAVVIGFFPSFVFVDRALTAVPRPLKDLAQVLGARRAEVLILIALPTAMPSLAVAVRLMASFAFLGTVTAEYLVGSQGLGRLLAESQFFLRTSQVWAISVLVIALSVGAYSSGGKFERWTRDRFQAF